MFVLFACPVISTLPLHDKPSEPWQRWVELHKGLHTGVAKAPMCNIKGGRRRQWRLSTASCLVSKEVDYDLLVAMKPASGNQTPEIEAAFTVVVERLSKAI
jgi:hypothetical protein